MNINLAHSPDIFFIGDTHFGHRAMVDCFRSDPAGGRFSSTDSMDEHLILEWNRTVPPKGIVFHLGDVAFMGSKATAATLAQLNGDIHLIEGNHDRAMPTWLKENFFTSVQPYLELSIKEHGDSGTSKRKIVLCHYALRTWNRANHGAWNIHGHSHGNLSPVGGQLDCGVDDERITNRLRPLTYREVADYMSGKHYVAVDHHGDDSVGRDK